MSALADLRALVREASARLGNPMPPVIVRTGSLEDGTPHIETDGAHLAYVISERGTELVRRAGLTPDDAAFHLMRAATVNIALAGEAKARRRGYSRWNWMAPHIAMMQTMKPGWGARLAQEYRDVLDRHPLSDAERAATFAHLTLPD